MKTQDYSRLGLCVYTNVWHDLVQSSTGQYQSVDNSLPADIAPVQLLDCTAFHKYTKTKPAIQVPFDIRRLLFTTILLTEVKFF